MSAPTTTIYLVVNADGTIRRFWFNEGQANDDAEMVSGLCVPLTANDYRP